MTTDRDQLKTQYRDGTNLDARVALHARFSTGGTHLHDWFLDQVDARGDARVLEVGCGTGALWQRVHARVPAGWRLTLTDFSHGMAASIAPLARAWGLNARLAQVDVQALPFAGASYDAAFANHMLYHVPDLPRGVAELARVLRPDGTLYAITNGLDHMHELIELAHAIGLPSHRIWDLAFRLENGVEVLSRSFGRVERHDYADGLEVTEAEPLVAYVVSMNASAGLMTAERESHLREIVEARLRRDGVIRIRKSTGLFIAREPRI